MKWITLKDFTKTGIKGVTLEPIYEDKILKGCIVRQGQNIVKLTQESYSNFKAQVPEPEFKHEVTATMHGVTFNASFATEEEAEEKKRELEREGIEGVTVTSAAVEPVSAGDEIPF